MKFGKIYIALACAMLCFSGCQTTKEVSSEDVIAEEPQTEETKKEETPAQPAKEEETTEQEATVRIDGTRKHHGILEEGIDYLSVEGIELEPGAEIAMIATNSGNKFFDSVKAGAQKAVEDLNSALGYTGKEKITLTFTAPKKESVVDQINIIDQFLDKAPDALCLAFTDSTACKTQIQMAKDNGIHLITFDTPDESHLTESLVASDNKAAAAEMASKLFKAIGCEGKVAIIVHNSLTQTGQDRKQAIIDELANNYNDKKIQFVDIVYMAQEDRSDKEVLDELLERNPDLAGIICTDLQTTETVLDYVENLEERNFEISGFDVSKKIVNAVKSGTMIGTMAQDPYGMGYATVVSAARSVAGLPNAGSVHSDHLWIDLSNIDTEETQSLIAQ